MSSSANPPICPDWVWVWNANVCAAKDRAWFVSYKVFSSRLDNYLRVAGIGTVKIKVQRTPNDSSEGNTAYIYLTDVLHVPDLYCNILGPQIEAAGFVIAYRGANDDTEGGIITKDYEKLAYFVKDHRYYAVQAIDGNGAPLGPSPFPPNCTMWHGLVVWPEAEMRRWKQHLSEHNFHSPPQLCVIVKNKDTVNTRAVAHGKQGAETTSHTNDAEGDSAMKDADEISPMQVSDYTVEECVLINRLWRGEEINFHLQFGLHPEDRVGGRRILRALIERLVEKGLWKFEEEKKEVPIVEENEDDDWEDLSV